MKKIFILCVVAVISFTAFQADESYAFGSIAAEVVFEDTLYGTGIGMVAGCAIAALTDDFSDHVNYIWKGAAIGALAGMAFGLYETQSAVLSNESGEFKFGITTIRPALAYESSSVDGIQLNIARINF